MGPGDITVTDDDVAIGFVGVVRRPRQTRPRQTSLACAPAPPAAAQPLLRDCFSFHLRSADVLRRYDAASLSSIFCSIVNSRVNRPDDNMFRSAATEQNSGVSWQPTLCHVRALADVGLGFTRRGVPRSLHRTAVAHRWLRLLGSEVAAVSHVVRVALDRSLLSLSRSARQSLACVRR